MRHSILPKKVGPTEIQRNHRSALLRSAKDPYFAIGIYFITAGAPWSSDHICATVRFGGNSPRSGLGRTRPFGSRLLLPSAKPVQIRKMRLSVSRAHALLTFRGGTRKDSSHAFWIDVERQECQWHSARVSPLVHKTERFVDQRTGCLGLRLTSHGVCARSRDDVIKRRA